MKPPAAPSLLAQPLHPPPAPFQSPFPANQPWRRFPRAAGRGACRRTPAGRGSPQSGRAGPGGAAAGAGAARGAAPAPIGSSSSARARRGPIKAGGPRPPSRAAPPCRPRPPCPGCSPPAASAPSRGAQVRPVVVVPSVQHGERHNPPPQTLGRVVSPQGGRRRGWVPRRSLTAVSRPRRVPSAFLALQGRRGSAQKPGMSVFAFHVGKRGVGQGWSSPGWSGEVGTETGPWQGNEVGDWWRTGNALWNPWGGWSGVGRLKPLAARGVDGAGVARVRCAAGCGAGHLGRPKAGRRTTGWSTSWNAGPQVWQTHC